MNPIHSFEPDTVCSRLAWTAAAFLALLIGSAPVSAQDSKPDAAEISIPGEAKPLDFDKAQETVVPLGADLAASQPGVFLPALPSELILELKQEDTLLKGRLRVGITRELGQPVTVGVARTGVQAWSRTAEGWHVWAIRLSAEGALGIRPCLEFLNLPPGARLLVYEAPKVPARVAPFTSENLPAKTDVWLPTVFSDTAVVECQVPPGVPVEAVSFSLRQVSHLYRPLVAESAKEGPCHNDVTCYASSWGGQAAGVALMHFQDAYGSYVCTGALLSDRDPNTYIDYFLTANHCISDSATAQSLECFWFYQTSSCNGPVPSISAVPRTYGADFLNGSSYSDATLLRLRQRSPSGVYYQGWSTSVPSGSMTCIHHPDDSYKRISFGALLRTGPDMWTVQWSSGVTEPGSSGAPLYNSSHLIVGQLYGGPSSCSNPNSTDDYGRFDVSFPYLKDYIYAEPLPNDVCAGAMPLAENVYATENTARAGNDVTPCYSSGLGSGVWFRWTASVDGYATVDTCGSDFDTAVAIFGGTCGSLESLACNDDAAACGSQLSQQASTNWPCTAGTIYYICAGGFNGASGNLKIRVRGTPGTPARFARTTTPVLNGIATDSVILEPGASLFGSFQYSAVNRQPIPGNYIVVVGLVNSFNRFVGGTPQVIYNASPNSAGEFGTVSWGGLTVPLNGGTYKLRFKGYASQDPAACISQFISGPPTFDTGNLQGLVGTVSVDPVRPWTFWWLNSAGASAFWNMDGTNVCSYQQSRVNVGAAAPGWKVVGASDFNGDGFDDLVWQNTNGWVAVWLLQGTNCLKQTRIGSAPAAPGWTVGATGDLDGDGHPDLLFQNTSGVTAVWLMDGTNITRQLRLNAPLLSSGWRMAAAGDFDRDGRLDLLFQHTTGAAAIWFMNGVSCTSYGRINAPAAVSGWRIVGAASLFDPQQSDILWQHQSGSLAFWAMTGLNRIGTGRLNPPTVDPSWMAVGPR